MSATQFVPLRAEGISEGEFLDDLDAELAELQEAISKFKRLYGMAAKGAVAELTVKIAMKVEDADDDAFSVKTTMATKLPKRPASVSIAMGGEDESGKLALFVRRAGGDTTHPRQMKLATRGGKIIDQVTGEVLDDNEQ